MYLKLLLDPYFQVSALEAILAWWDCFVLYIVEIILIFCTGFRTKPLGLKIP